MKRRTFAYGWSLVFYTALLFMLGAGITVDGLNVIVPAFAEARHWDYNMLLSFSSLGGIAGFLGTIAFAQLVVKKGVRFMIVLSLFISGVATIVYGYANSLIVYIIALCVLFFAVNGYSFIAPTTIITNWFPRKKGIAFGIATIGLPLATALFVPVLALLFGSFGHANGLMIIGVATIILAAISIFWVKNTPEEIGLAPDGEQLSAEEIEAQRKELESHKTEWTIGRLLKTKNVWVIAVGYGFIFLVTVGIVSQFVPRVMSLGYDQAKALSFLSLCAIIAIPGSYVWGLLDQKTTTKKASIVLALWYLVALVLLIISKQSLVLLMLAIIMVGFGIGGIGNLQPSMVAQVFGRRDYPAANRVVTPIISLIRILAFAVVGMALAATGSFDGAYMVLMGFNVVALILIAAINDLCVGKTEHSCQRNSADSLKC